MRSFYLPIPNIWSGIRGPHRCEPVLYSLRQPLLTHICYLKMRGGRTLATLDYFDVLILFR
jgi:hypothetical protein